MPRDRLFTLAAANLLGDLHEVLELALEVVVLDRLRLELDRLARRRVERRPQIPLLPAERVVLRLDVLGGQARLALHVVAHGLHARFLRDHCRVLLEILATQLNELRVLVDVQLLELQHHRAVGDAGRHVGERVVGLEHRVLRALCLQRDELHLQGAEFIGQLLAPRRELVLLILERDGDDVVFLLEVDERVLGVVELRRDVAVLVAEEGGGALGLRLPLLEVPLHVDLGDGVGEERRHLRLGVLRRQVHDARVLNWVDLHAAQRGGVDVDGGLVALAGLGAEQRLERVHLATVVGDHLLAERARDGDRLAVAAQALHLGLHRLLLRPPIARDLDRVLEVLAEVLRRARADLHHHRRLVDLRLLGDVNPDQRRNRDDDAEDEPHPLAQDAQHRRGIDRARAVVELVEWAGHGLPQPTASRGDPDLARSMGWVKPRAEPDKESARGTQLTKTEGDDWS